MRIQSMAAAALAVLAVFGPVRADEHDMDGFKLYPCVMAVQIRCKAMASNVFLNHQLTPHCTEQLNC